MRLFVSGLSYGTTNGQLHDLFARAGHVEDAQIVLGLYSRHSLGYGFVEMPDDSEARAAIRRFHGRSVGLRRLAVSAASTDEMQQEEEQQQRELDEALAGMASWDPLAVLGLQGL